MRTSNEIANMDQQNERRKRVLSDTDIDALAQAIHGGMNAEEHAEHHHAVRTWIDRENRKAERAEKIKTQIEGWFIVSLLGGIGTSGYHALQYLREHLK